MNPIIVRGRNSVLQMRINDGLERRRVQMALRPAAQPQPGAPQAAPPAQPPKE